MVAFNKIKVATGEAPLVSAIGKDDISTRRAWGLWVCLTEMDKGGNGLERIEPDTSKISQDLRKIQKTVQDYGHRLIHMPMKIENLSQKMDEILKILPDLQKGIIDMKTELVDLKKNQRDSHETSKSRQERIRDAFGIVPLLHQKGKGMEVPKPEIRDERI
ncbi:UNVERIFIED_CONTAM: hypothetical protein Sradi_1895000 [Sesamum radiatum]|uniref:Uncharacterized protein n=1 Tax=Sesamum radiatum TaxID=300843 RepID=A0AAW2U1C0_SESRA